TCEAYFSHAQLHCHTSHPGDFLEAQQGGVRHELVIGAEHFTRHTVGATEVAAVGDRYSQVMQRPSTCIEHRALDSTRVCALARCHDFRGPVAGSGIGASGFRGEVKHFAHGLTMLNLFCAPRAALRRADMSRAALPRTWSFHVRPKASFNEKTLPISRASYPTSSDT